MNSIFMKNSQKKSFCNQGQIAIIGSGSVAQALGKLLYIEGQPVVALSSRNLDHASRAAAFINPAIRVVACSEIPSLASRVLIAVSDDAISEVGETLVTSGMRKGMVLHTCGSVGPEALDMLMRVGVSCGVIHPLQTVSSPEQGIESLKGVAVGLSGDGMAIAWAEEIVKLLKGYIVRIESQAMPIYHASAVLASNAIVAFIDAATVLLSHVGLDRKEAILAISQISRTSLNNTLRSGPTSALTGPVARGDAGTIERQALAMQKVEPGVTRLYLAVNNYLLDVARRGGLPEDRLRAVELVLEAVEFGDNHGSHKNSGA
jgi:predicted short-subunit dehydrogenase-like oxidoreductase (DUF2520 family)